MKPETIQFAMLNESGHLNPTFKLAKQLRARGHQVRYLASAEVAPLIEGQGFEVDPLYPDLMGHGAPDKELGTLARRRAITTRYQALLDRLLADPPLPRRPSLLVVDVTQTHFAYWARRTGVPFIHVNTSLPQTQDPGVPPLRSGAAFGANVLTRIAPELAWRRFVAQRRLSAELASLGGMRPPYDLARVAAGKFGVKQDELQLAAMYMPQLRGVPELVLCPQAFDFPRAPAPLRSYVESIDLDRPEPEFAWAGLARDKPLIYCALGGQRYRAEDVPGFFRRLVDVFRAHPEWQLLLALGQHMRAEELAPPANVALVARAPQLAVLQRARLMITHGGLGSVKECISRGVPMLGVPLDVDQPGNVARVVHHGLGLASDVRRASTRELGADLTRLLAEPGFLQRTQAMQARFREHEAAQRGADLVERHAQGATNATA